MAKPTSNTTWATAPATPNVEPSAGEKAAGWTPGGKPPAEFHNWWMNAVSDWNAWLDAFESTVHTWTAVQTHNSLVAFIGGVTATHGSGLNPIEVTVDGPGVGVNIDAGSDNLAAAILAVGAVDQVVIARSSLLNGTGFYGEGNGSGGVGVTGLGMAAGVKGRGGDTTSIGVYGEAELPAQVGVSAANISDTTTVPLAAAWAVGASTATATHRTGPGAKNIGGSATGGCTDAGGDGALNTGGASPTTGGIGSKDTGGAASGNGTGGVGTKSTGGAGAGTGTGGAGSYGLGGAGGASGVGGAGGYFEGGTGGAGDGAAIEIGDGDGIKFTGASTLGSTTPVPANTLVKGLTCKASGRVETGTDTLFAGSQNVVSAVASASYVTVTLATAMADTNYIVMAQFNDSGAGQPISLATSSVCNILILSSSQFAVYPPSAVNPSTTGAGYELNFLVFGHQ